jgi:hypothetical protein
MLVVENGNNMDGFVKIDIRGLEKVKQRLFSKMADEQTARLLEYAPLMLAKAYNQKTFNNDTWNLADSYVWVVYYHGAVKGSGFLWNSRIASSDVRYHHTKVNGRKLAESFIATYAPKISKGWEIVWAATAPYSTYLESGARGHKFKVMSSIYDEIVSDFKGRAEVIFENNY